MPILDKLNDKLESHKRKVMYKRFEKFVRFRKGLKNVDNAFKTRTEDIENMKYKFILSDSETQKNLLKLLKDETSEYFDKRVLEANDFIEKIYPLKIDKKLDKQLKKEVERINNKH